jgi:hypothetical protein
VTDLEGLLFRRTEKGLVAADIHSSEWLEKTKLGQEVMLTGRRPRNVKLHRLAFGLFKLVLENDPLQRWTDVEHVLDDLKRETRHGEYVVDGLSGELRFRTHSISFSAMSEDQFKPWFNRCVEILAEKVLRIAPQELADEVFAMVNGSKNDGWKVS